MLVAERQKNDVPVTIGSSPIVHRAIDGVIVCDRLPLASHPGDTLEQVKKDGGQLCPICWPTLD